ncbi:hypothetical protein BDW02DRAFT_346840 [Decorospora gaudefroyi]|uniref:Uncharacterized protein n=1 Tax=Decorospora gaudefroyi TaxID=184978 RepID=A0A6A5K8Y1_9PLEO|nr:hypothetical protein BDW02DRAFT_346840 [Decorospora gaudefroyi]
MAPSAYSANTASTPTLTHQPHTAPFLARLAAFILHAPLPTVKSVLRSSSVCNSDSDSDSAFTSACASVNPNSKLLRSDAATSAMCQRLLRLLNELILKFPRADIPSPDTIPLALCLLYHYRMRRSDKAPVDAPCMLIAIAVHIAYKFLTNDFQYVNLQHWACPLELNRQGCLDAERMFLGAIDYRVWVGQEEYLELKGRFGLLWDQVFKKAARPVPPPFLLKGLGRMG